MRRGEGWVEGKEKEKEEEEGGKREWGMDDIPSEKGSKFNKNKKIRTEVRAGGWVGLLMHLVNVLAQVRRGQQAAGPYVAYRLVHCLAIRSCSALLVMYCVAMLPTRGSAGREAESGVSIYQRHFLFQSRGKGLSGKSPRSRRGCGGGRKLLF